MLDGASETLAGILSLASLIMLFWLYKYREPNLKLFFFIAAVMGIFAAIHIINYIPVMKSNYPTNTSPYFYYARRVMGWLRYDFIQIFAFLITALSGETIAREIWPNENKLIASHRDPMIAVSHSALRGICLAGFKLGYLIGFYFLVKSLGGWKPLHAPFRNSFGSWFPFLVPLHGGLFPALTEEALFRLFAISFILLKFRRLFPVLLIPAVIWAFCHSGYMSSPVYLRGLELTIAGLIYGYIFFRYDILTLVMAHFSYNAILGATPLLRSDEPYLFGCGVVILIFILTPPAIGGIRYAQQRIAHQSKGKELT
jgi:membrane protease YdiL (CAAX protease family)